MIARRTALACASLLFAACAAAQEPAARPAHVRSESADLLALIQATADQSPTVRALIDRLDRSDVVVYVRARPLPSASIDGRTGLLSAAAGSRYLVIELACPRSVLVQSVTLAHELHHAVEIADAPEVVSAVTLERFYAEIGEKKGDPGHWTFETAAARAVGERVRRELTRRLQTSDF
jgi:hypothetical protein